MPDLRGAMRTPWKAWNEVWRWLAYPRVRLLFAMNAIPWGSGWRIYGVPVIQKHRVSRMIFGPGFQLRSLLRSNPMAPNHPVVLSTYRQGASLEIGANFRMTGGNLCAAQKIIIGDHVVIGANTTIVDTDFHPADPVGRWVKPSDGRAAEVVIEDNVFIGMNCLVLKGVRIGRGSVIGAGSVVAKGVPSGVIAAGNPAVIIGELDSDRLLTK